MALLSPFVARAQLIRYADAYASIRTDELLYSNKPSRDTGSSEDLVSIALRLILDSMRQFLFAQARKR